LNPKTLSGGGTSPDWGFEEKQRTVHIKTRQIVNEVVLTIALILPSKQNRIVLNRVVNQKGAEPDNTIDRGTRKLLICKKHAGMSFRGRSYAGVMNQGLRPRHTA